MHPSIMRVEERIEERPLMTVEAASKRLAISDRTLWTLTKRGDVPHIRIGRSVRFDPVDLDAYIAKQRIGSQR